MVKVLPKKYKGDDFMKNLRVTNIMINGRGVANQYWIHYNEDGCHYTIFQSYDSMIVKMKDWKIIEVGKDWDASRTTGKYRNKVTYMDKKAFEKMLDEEFEWNEETQSYHKK